MFRLPLTTLDTPLDTPSTLDDSLVAPDLPDGVAPEVRAEHEYWIKRAGHITNMKRLMLQDLPTYRSYMVWYELYENLLLFLDRRALDLFCYAISTTNHCLVCSTYFRQIFADAGDALSPNPLTDIEQLLLDFGAAISANPNQVPDELYAQLEQQFSTQQIVQIIGFAGQMVATNYFNMIAHVEVDSELQEYVTPEFLALVAAEDRDR